MSISLRLRPPPLRPLPAGAPTGPNWPTIQEYNEARENGRVWPHFDYWDNDEATLWGPFFGSMLYKNVASTYLRDLTFSRHGMAIDWFLSFPIEEPMLERIIYNLVKFFNEQIVNFFYLPAQKPKKPFIRFQLSLFKKNENRFQHLFSTNFQDANAFSAQLGSTLSDIDRLMHSNRHKDIWPLLSTRSGSKSEDFFRELFHTPFYTPGVSYRWDLRIFYGTPNRRFWLPSNLIEAEEVLANEMNFFDP